jgi:L-fuculose-phosphate aldolase
MTSPQSTSRCYIHPADELVSAMERIYRYSMTTTSGGNLSICDSDGSIWITPARVDKGNLTREDIVHVLPDGSVEGRHPASSEFPFHKNIYQLRPDLKAIVHAHPVALVAFSISGITPNTRILAKAHSVCGKVGFAPYALPGSTKLGENIAKVFAEGFNCVLLENHGVAIGGTSFKEAFERFESLEFACRTSLKSRAMGVTPHFLSDEQLAQANSRKLGFGTFTPASPSTLEQAVRRDLCEFVRRGYRQRLLISTEGSFSARVDSESFVITSHDTDRATVESPDLVLVHQSKFEEGKTPSQAAGIHQAIYAKYPEIHSVVIATPVNATAFSVAHNKLDVRTIPESYIFLRDVKALPFAWAYGDGGEIAGAVTPEFPVALLEDGGALVIGRTILDAFDRLEVLESTSEAVINAGFLGAVKPMDDEVIDELIGAFLK